MSFCIKANLLRRTAFLMRIIFKTKPAHYNEVAKILPTVSARFFHKTTPTLGLEEFFDDEENWGATIITVGRPWKKDELRLKSNQDLHKLWYILLKERNMVMTMQETYNENSTKFPAPERIEKVEESMENLLDVVAERDRAVNLLETGETGEPGRRWVVNELGRGVWRSNTEHEMPIHANPGYLKDTQLPRQTRWAVPYKRLYREKMENEKLEKEYEDEIYERKLRRMLPDEEYHSG